MAEKIAREDLRRSMEEILRTALEREADSYEYYYGAALDICMKEKIRVVHVS